MTSIGDTDGNFKIKHRIRIGFPVNMRYVPVIADDSYILGLLFPGGDFRSDELLGKCQNWHKKNEQKRRKFHAVKIEGLEVERAMSYGVVIARNRFKKIQEL